MLPWVGDGWVGGWARGAVNFPDQSTPHLFKQEGLLHTVHYRQEVLEVAVLVHLGSLCKGVGGSIIHSGTEFHSEGRQEGGSLRRGGPR